MIGLFYFTVNDVFKIMTLKFISLETNEFDTNFRWDKP